MSPKWKLYNSNHSQNIEMSISISFWVISIWWKPIPLGWNHCSYFGLPFSAPVPTISNAVKSSDREDGSGQRVLKCSAGYRSILPLRPLKVFPRRTVFQRVTFSFIYFKTKLEQSFENVSSVLHLPFLANQCNLEWLDRFYKVQKAQFR